MFNRILFTWHILKITVLISFVTFTFFVCSKPANAELAIQTHPAAVTSDGTALVVLEASSQHAGVRVFFPEKNQAGAWQTRAASLLLQPSNWEPEDPARWQDMSSVELLLRDIGGPSAIAVSIIDNDWRGDLTGVEDTPSSTLRWAIRVQPSDAANIAAQLEREWLALWGIEGLKAADVQTLRDLAKENNGQPDNTALTLLQSENAALSALSLEELRAILAKFEKPVLSYDLFHHHSRNTFELAVRNSRAAQISSDGNTLALPQNETYSTGLGWLYRAMLTVEGEGPLRGCEFGDAFHAGAGAVDGSPWAMYRGLISELEQMKPDSISRQFRDELRTHAQGGWGTQLLIEGIEAFELVRRAARGIGAATEDSELYAEFAIMGDLDPASVEIAACTAHRMLAGYETVTNSIRERSLIYGEVDRVIASRWSTLDEDAQPPRFFSAAQRVTRLLGLGFVELADAYELETYPEYLVSAAQLGLVNSRCAGLEIGENFLPTPAAKEAVLGVNEKLFDFVNLTEMLWLANNPGELRMPGDRRRFDPPPTMNEALAFDLHMVLREQAAVEDILGQYPLKTSDVASLTASQNVLYCLRFASLLESENGNLDDLFPLIKFVKASLETLANEGIIPSADATFGNYWYRVATGMSYIIALHREKPDLLVPLLRDLISAERSAGSRLQSLPINIRRELEVLVDVVENSEQPVLPVELVDAVNLFLDPNLSYVELFDCEEQHVLRELKLTAIGTEDENGNAQEDKSILSVSDRVSILANHGLWPIAQGYDILPNGGLFEDASMPGGSRGIDLCAAISQRREAFDTTIRDAIAGPILEASQSVLNVFVFERSMELRRSIGELAPFVHLALQPPAKPRDANAMLGILREAADRRAAYLANMALLNRIAVMSREDRIKILPDMDIAELRDLLAEAQIDTEEDKRAVPEDRIEEIAAKRTVEARAIRIQSTETKIYEAMLEILSALTPSSTAETKFAPSEGFGDMRYSHQTLAFAAVSPPTGRTRTSLFGAAFAGTGVDAQLSRTGRMFADGTQWAGLPEYQMDLVLRRPPVHGGTATSEAGTSSVDVSSVDQLIPLGINIAAIHIDSEGDFLRNRIGVERPFEVNVPELRAAFAHLGLPSFLMPESFTPIIEFEEDGFQIKRLALQFDLSLGDARLTNVKVPLIENGNSVDLERTLRENVSEALEQQLSGALASSAQYVRMARYPQRDAAWQAAHMRFGIAPFSEKNPLEYVLDWEGQTLAVHPRFALELGMDPDSRIKIWASTEVIMSQDAFSIRRFSFDDDMAAKMQMYARNLIASLEFDRDLADSLTLTPFFDGTNIWLDLRAGLKIAGCDTVIEERLAFDASAVVNSFGTLLTNAAGDLAKCSTQQLLSGMTAKLDGTEVSLFGITFEVSYDRFDGQLDKNFYKLTVTGEAFSGCTSLPPVVEIAGVSTNLNGEISFNALPPESINMLGKLVACKLEAAFPQIRDYIQITNVVLGDNTVAVDITLQNVPFLGTVPLGLVNFSASGSFESAARAAFSAAAAAALNEELSSRFAGKAVDIAGVGSFLLDTNAPIQTDVLSDNPQITLNGSARIGGFDLPISLIFPLDGGDFRVVADKDAIKGIVGGALVGQLTSMLPAMPGGNGIVVDQFAFGPLDDRNLRWGLVMRVKAGFELGGLGIDVKLDRVVLDDSGITLPPSIRIGLSTPLYFPPVALSKVLLTYHTRSSPGREGLELGAELTFLEPQLAKIIKFVANLDLRNIDKLLFKMEGDLVVLDSIAIFESTAELDLGKARFEFHGYTTEAIRDFIDLNVEGKVDVPRTLIRTESHLAILGITLSENELSLCAKAKYCTEEIPEGFSLDAMFDFLIGKGTVGAFVDLGFEEMTAKSDLILNLFGWSPGGAHLDADLRRAQVGFSFLGLDLEVTTPSISTMTPSLLLSILESLFDIDLADLLKMDPTKIKISLVSGSGDVTSQGGESNDDGGNPPGEPGPAPEPLPVPGVEGKNGEAVPPENPTFGGRPQVERAGVTVDGYACQKWIGDNQVNDFDAGEQGARIQIEGWSSSARGFPIPNRWVYVTHTDGRRLPLSWNDPFWKNGFSLEHSKAYTGRAAAAVCLIGGDQPIQMRPGFALTFSQRAAQGYFGLGNCEENIPELSLQPLPDAENKRFDAAGLPVFCLSNGESIDSRIYWNDQDGQFYVLFRCPYENRLNEADVEGLYYQAMCGSDTNGYITISPELAGIDGGKIIAAAQELDLMNRVIRPMVLGQQPQLPTEARRFEFARDGKKFRVRETISLPANTRIFAVEIEHPDGSLKLNEHRVLADDPLEPYFADTRANSIFTQELLERWSSGSRPRKVLAALDTGPELLLLGDEGQFDALLYDGGVLRQIKMDMPSRIAAVDTDITISPLVIQTFFKAIIPEILLLEDQTHWQVIFGIDVDRSAHIISLIGLPLTGDSRVRILLDSFNADGKSIHGYPLSEVYTGDYRQSPDLAADRIERRYCQTARNIVEGYAQVFNPDIQQPPIRELPTLLGRPQNFGGEFVNNSEILFAVLGTQLCVN